MVPRTVRIGSKLLGEGTPCYVIAEAGVNHNGDLALARRLVHVAADAGADAIKFQTFSAGRLATVGAPKAKYQAATTQPDESQMEMLRRLELDERAHAELRDEARSRGIEFLSSPFDEESADLLVRLGVRAIKIGSGEITNLPFLQHLAQSGLPLLLSTGMSYLAEVEEAVASIHAARGGPLALLHCVSAYPAAAADANLRAMDTLRTAFAVPVGFSDHTQGVEVALAAVARGAALLEKHITLDRSMSGPDHSASMAPDEFAALVRAVRLVEAALGDGVKRPRGPEVDNTAIGRKSIVLRAPVRAGERLTRSHLAMKRPGSGLAPRELPRVVGRVARQDLAADHIVGWEDLA
ncbi:MAG TPA: N-acetylneuraminate synthase [Candidatus Thermoplasmatota archaeon]|nr:N-acetylneuraminate synthase [Candidatus Thermoplasmatota archaeon]